LPQEDIDSSLSKAERHQLNKLLRAIAKLAEGDIATAESLTKLAATRIAMAAYETFDARLVLHKAFGVPEYSAWDDRIRRILYAELRGRGLTFVPSQIDPFAMGTWWGALPRNEEE
jgi:hypothetical protein